MVRRNLAEVLAGAVVLIIAAGFLVYAIVNSGRNPVGAGYPLYAQFTNFAGLAVGSEVRVAGVKIRVVDSESIDPKTYLANVG
jgi:phospholipid/cholesterol/gamma-HCH transport system substrate-binding protein